METYSEIIANGIKSIENSTWLSNCEGVSPLHKTHSDVNYHIDTCSYKPVISPVQVKRIEQLLFQYTRLAENFTHNQKRDVKVSRTPQSQFRRRQSLKISQDLRHIADVAKTPTHFKLQDTPQSRKLRKSEVAVTHHSRTTPVVKLFANSPEKIIAINVMNSTAHLFSLLTNSLENQYMFAHDNLLDSNAFCNETNLQLESIDNIDLYVFDSFSSKIRSPLPVSFRKQFDDENSSNLHSKINEKTLCDKGTLGRSNLSHDVDSNVGF
jgi:Tfp pilus assembly protein PilE